MTRRLLAMLVALLAALAATAVWALPAQAAGHTVTLTTQGPTPSKLTIKLQDTVTFKAGDTRTYHLKSTGGGWSLNATVTPAKPFSTPAFTKSGAYTYDMTFDLLPGGPPSGAFAGSITVPTQATPSPTPSRSPSPRPVTTTRPPATQSASPSAVPTQSGVAIQPPITGGIVPTPDVTATGGPTPQVAGPTPTSTSPAPHIAYADPSGIVQGSHRSLGLPAMLAAIAAVGVVTLIVRLLLAAPEATPRAEPEVR